MSRSALRFLQISLFLLIPVLLIVIVGAHGWSQPLSSPTGTVKGDARFDHPRAFVHELKRQDVEVATRKSRGIDIAAGSTGSTRSAVNSRTETTSRIGTATAPPRPAGCAPSPRRTCCANPGRSGLRSPTWR